MRCGGGWGRKGNEGRQKAQGGCSGPFLSGGQGDESALVVMQDGEQKENDDTQVAKRVAPTLVGRNRALEVRPDSIEIGELVDKLTFPGFDLDTKYLTSDRISDSRHVVVDVVMDAAGWLGREVDEETVALFVVIDPSFPGGDCLGAGHSQPDGGRRAKKCGDVHMTSSVGLG